MIYQRTRTLIILFRYHAEIKKIYMYIKRLSEHSSVVLDMYLIHLSGLVLDYKSWYTLQPLIYHDVESLASLFSALLCTFSCVILEQASPAVSDFSQTP